MFVILAENTITEVYSLYYQKMEQIKEYVISLLKQNPYVWIFLFMCLESMFIPFPSEIVMIPAWRFAAKWHINIHIAIALGTLWSIAGALINYYIAFIWWEKLSKKIIWEEKHNLWVNFFEKYGDITTFVWRLIPVIRQYISFPAGLFKMNLWKFVFYTWFGAFIWINILAYIGYYFWNNSRILDKYKHYILIWGILLFVLLVLIKFYILKRYKKKWN